MIAKSAEPVSEARPSAPVGIPLSQLASGQCGTVCACEVDGLDGAMMRAMGLCPRARVRVCRSGGRMIVAVSPDVPGSGGVPPGALNGAAQSRIGLARELAKRVLVRVDA